MTPTEMQALKATLEEAERIKERIQGTTLDYARNKYYSDPLGFVMAEWPWGVAGGPLEHETGPDDYQKQFLIDLGDEIKKRNFDGHTPVAPILMSIASGNGTGKTSLFAFLTWFIMRTRPGSKGTVTSGDFQQLKKTVWADIMFWGQLARGGKDFDIQKLGIFRNDDAWREKWFVTPRTAAPERAQSFAGQHARTATSFAIFDESSQIHDEIFKKMDTCMTDGEPMFFCGGQMLKNHGEFFDRVYGSRSSRWNMRTWDGRSSRFTNKQFIKDWAEEYGVDSDYYRVHVLGLPPQASELQYIGQSLIDGAKVRIHKPLPDEPLVWGYDAANGGLAKHCFWARRGLDAKSIPPISLPGDTPRDAIVAKAAELMSDRRPGFRATAMFADQAFGSVIIARLHALGFTNVFEVNFGEPSTDKHFFNRRAQMWAGMKEWLTMGAVPEDNEKMLQQFMCPGFGDRNGKLVIESKENMAKRGIRALDYPDALALTFAQKVAPPPLPQKPVIPTAYRGGGSLGWVR